MCVAWCLLFVVRCDIIVDVRCCLLFAGGAVCCLWFDVCRLLFVECSLLLVECYLFVVCRALCDVRCLLFICGLLWLVACILRTVVVVSGLAVRDC